MPRRLTLGSVLFLAACSLFPDEAPLVGAGAPDGGAAGGGSGGAGAGGGRDAGGAGGSAGMPIDATADRLASGGEGGFDGSAESDAAPEAGSSGTVAYEATIADCLEQGELDPNACRSFAESQSGDHKLWVDVRRPPRWEFRGFLRFELGEAIQGATVSSVLLEVTAASPLDGGFDAPAVWQVQEFQTRAELFVSEPMPIGGAPLSGAPEAIDGVRLSYRLPESIVKENDAIHLGLLPVGGSVALWNANGEAPPRLVVEYE